MASQATSNAAIAFLDGLGNEIPEPIEWTKGKILVRIPPDEYRHYRLSVNGERLQLTRTVDEASSGERVEAQWDRHGTGSYRIELSRVLAEGTLKPEAQTSYRIWPKKLSKESFSSMLLELDMGLPAKVSIALQQLGSLAGVEILRPDQTTVAQELQRLHRAVDGTSDRPGLPHSLAKIASDPYRMLRTTVSWCKIADSRRPDLSRFDQIISKPGNLDTNGRLEHVLDTRVEHTINVYENRVIRAYVTEVERRLRRLRQALAPVEANAGETDTLSGQVSAMQKHIDVARSQAQFLHETDARPPNNVRATMVLARKAGYRQSFQGLLEMRRSFSARLDEPSLDVPLEKVPELYQLWTTLVVFHSLLVFGISRNYTCVRQSLVSMQSDGLFVRVLPGGEPILELLEPRSGTRVLATPERQYGKVGELVSTSFSQIPDLSVEIRRPDSDPVLLIFDAKYKLESDEGDEPRSVPKKVDIDKMHAYRDAIRTREQRTVVEYAAIMYPGQYVPYKGMVEALPAIPASAPPGTFASLPNELDRLLTQVWEHALP
jgi:hypothetical protein